ncbi:pyruvate kinase [Sulfurivermis fontis]|uniref:pyruvate kinase n=1 Tax=Sulfurivermis fontis TaxID=1972068 RepID=UPI001E2CE570|nr:pyruvate kinase [Sulfurivermis fontis]
MTQPPVAGAITLSHDSAMDETGMAASNDELRLLRDDVIALRARVVSGAEKRLLRLRACYADGRFTASARNLAHYLELRRTDLRPLQERLAAMGLSSLGRGESHVDATLAGIITLLTRAIGAAPDLQHNGGPAFGEGHRLLLQHTDTLFGPARAQRRARIMVTLPSEAARDYDLVLGLLQAGMDVARINCAHDDATAWEAMINNLRRAERDSNLHCRVLMDLAGHKLRTGPVSAVPAVLHIRPQRDEFGLVVTPAQILLEPAAQCSLVAEDERRDTYLRLQIPLELHEQLRPGDRLRFSDGRGKRRELDIIARTPAERWLAHCARSAYLSADTVLELRRRDSHHRWRRLGHYALCPFPGQPQALRLYWGDQLLLRRDAMPGQPAQRDGLGNIIAPASIGCTLPAVIDWLQPGDPVWFDDGKLGTEVDAVTPQGALLRVTHAAPAGVNLRSDKGINFPNTRLELPPLAQKDLQDLDFVCRHADMVGFSYVETLADMECMMQELARRGRAELPIIAKIETARAVSNLGELLLGTIGRHELGIMIARGDLAVELGGVRLAEIQEEILWLCEAAHVPVIWATQVLETLTQKGIRSRPELTDAAMGGRAECVMLNKGPYVLDAVRLLDEIMRRMEAHQHKKTSRLRALGLAGKE